MYSSSGRAVKRCARDREDPSSNPGAARAAQSARPRQRKPAQAGASRRKPAKAGASCGRVECGAVLPCWSGHAGTAARRAAAASHQAAATAGLAAGAAADVTRAGTGPAGAAMDVAEAARPGAAWRRSGLPLRARWLRRGATRRDYIAQRITLEACGTPSLPSSGGQWAPARAAAAGEGRARHGRHTGTASNRAPHARARSPCPPPPRAKRRRRPRSAGGDGGVAGDGGRTGTAADGARADAGEANGRGGEGRPVTRRRRTAADPGQRGTAP